MKRTPLKRTKMKRKTQRRVQLVKVFYGGREVAAFAEYMKRRQQMFERQKGICALCLRPMLDDVTFDHEVPRGLGGAMRDDRIWYEDGTWRNAAVHYDCNVLKSSKRYKWSKGAYIPCPR